jgi:hypothetical protein
MSASKVRTVCGSSARTGLCGGRSAMTVPTAIEETVPFANSYPRYASTPAVNLSATISGSPHNLVAPFQALTPEVKFL